MEYKVSLAHNYAENRSLTDSERASFIADFKATSDNEEMRKAFAASLSVPVLQAIPPQTSVRDIFAVDPIPAGAQAEYPVAIDEIESAVVMPRFGTVPQNIIVGESLIVPTFQVSNSVEWSFSFVRDGRYNIVESALKNLAQSFVKMEEKAGWDTIRGAINTANTLTTTETSLSKTLLNDMITEFTAEGLTPSVIYCSPRRGKDIREWVQTNIDPVTQREIFQAGGLSSIWNVQLRELRTLADDEIFLFDTTRLGVMPIKTQLTTHDDPMTIRNLRAGVIAWEEIGFAVIDKRALLYVNL